MQLIEQKRYPELKQELQNIRPVDIAHILEELNERDTLLVFRLLSKGIAADVFSHLSSEKQAELSTLVDEKELSDILDELFFDDKIDYLEEMPANVVKKILKNTSEMERKLINQFLMYPDYSAGSLMTIEFVDLKKEMLAKDALARIRKIAPDKETIYTCYAIDEERHLEGTVTLKDIVLAGDDVKIENIMQKNPIYVKTHDDQEYVADIFKKYDLLAVPVVDNEKRLVGIITIDDVVDVIEQEATEDFYRMAAVQPSEESYLDTDVFTLARKRIVWLLVLMISATFTGFIIDKYQVALESVVALASFIPMLMNNGGNAGSQASTLIIRGLVLGEIDFKNIFTVIWKEARVALIVGSILSLVNFMRVYLIQGYSLQISLTVSITIVITIMVAEIIGGILPIIAQKLKLDPAMMASPLITTIVDATTLAIYFTLAVWIIGITV
ncbi:MAG TPA: magnesium transporter [Clostridiaceae bacterium]|nr:magnesium transporter [Clostridiaceae bacterium]